MTQPRDTQEARWQAEAEQAERDRRDAPMTPAVDHYRLVIRALQRPLPQALPADFPAQVLARVALTERRSAVDDALVTGLLVALALAGLILTWPYLQPLLAQLQTLPAAAALSDGLAGAARTIPWTPLIAAAASVIAALGIERGLLRGRRNEVRS